MALKLLKRFKFSFKRKGKFVPVKDAIAMQIEAHPKIKKQEMMWGFDSEQKRLYPVATKRSRRSFVSDYSAAARFDHLLQTHVDTKYLGERIQGKKPLEIALPSKSDLFVHARVRMQQSWNRSPKTLKSSIVSVLDRKGKEKGRTEIKITETGIRKLFDDWNNTVQKEGSLGEWQGDLISWVQKYGITITFIPSKGYEYDAMKKTFIKKKEKK
jgi:hypothetical protein